jgi:ADP-dependent NAD(P)H-hydrate dehydratase / NAD(P)H-hydrate epimerase
VNLAAPEQMLALDRAASKDFGIPGLVLMENAGRAILEQMEAEFGPVAHRSVCVFVGPGSNGGDGLVIGRHVLQRGGSPLLIFLAEPDTLRGDAAVNAAICAKLNLPRCVIRQETDLAEAEERIRQLHFDRLMHSIVDALFGTGLTRTLEGRFAAAVRFINNLAQRQHWPVVSADLPSGLCGQTGMPLGIAVQADLTVSCGLAKPGHYLHGGAEVGKLVVVDIGIPLQAIEAAKLPGTLLDRPAVAAMLRPRPKAGHKGTFGHLLILAGSEGKTGAALMTAHAALRSGCGLVTLAVPAALNPIFEAALPEAMTVPLPHSDKTISAADYELISALAADKEAVVIGPGIGTAPETGELLLRLHRRLSQPVLLDADALNLLAKNLLCIEDSAGPRILTPHPGEMAHLTGMKTAEIQADRLKAARWLAEARIRDDHEMITVLKGAGTVVCSSQGRWAVNSSGNSGMAVGGAGDVLSGLIGGLLAQGFLPWEAAAAGVFLHGLAADLLAKERIQGFTASEIAAALPSAFMELFHS